MSTTSTDRKQNWLARFYSEEGRITKTVQLKRLTRADAEKLATERMTRIARTASFDLVATPSKGGM